MAQRHIIKRQVVELQVGSAASAQQLQAEVSRIYRQRIVPLIERYCNEFSSPERIHRIDALELNLGTVHPQHLEEDLVASVSRQLRALLAEQITADERHAEAAGSSRKTTSQLELFGVFAQTGSLPWWADASPPHLLDDTLQYLIDHASGPLCQLMGELAHAQSSLQRIVHHFADRLLAALAATLAPALDLTTLARIVRDLVSLLQSTANGGIQVQTRLRHLVWSVLMQWLSLRGERETTWPPLLHAVLIRVAAELGVSYATLLSGMHRLMQQDQSSFQGALGEIIKTLYTAYLHTPGSSPPLAGEEQGEERLQWTSLLQLFRTLATQLPEPGQGLLLAALDRLASRARDHEAVVNLLQVLQAALVQQHLPRTLGAQWHAALEQLAVVGFSPGQVQVFTEILPAILRQVPSALTAETRPETVTTPLDLTFSDADELYINNAGLVILHPFLRHFFTRLELLENRQFKETACRQRAVGLLQYVVSEDPFPPEYLLPLNKTLCGMELDDVFDFGPPVTEDEADECTNLLTAVIANAPILKNMSVQGLRGTFLLRQGILSSRDGAWLLRVERETYDVVLDRFPWTLQWVKLPWMDTPLRVEW